MSGKSWINNDREGVKKNKEIYVEQENQAIRRFCAR